MGDIRGLAIYKDDGSDWTIEEGTQLTSLCDPSTDDYIKAEFLEAEFIYDDGDSVNFFYNWPQQNVNSKHHKISFNTLFGIGTDRELHVTLLKDEHFAVGYIGDTEAIYCSATDGVSVDMGAHVGILIPDAVRAIDKSKHGLYWGDDSYRRFMEWYNENINNL